MRITNSYENYAKTNTDTTFNFSNTAEEIRGGQGNVLLGKYFHDSNFAMTMTDAMFNLHYVAATLGSTVESGGISIKEEKVIASKEGNKLVVTETPVATAGTLIGWYRKPTETAWNIGTFIGNEMTISGDAPSEPYCVKYFYHNENARSIVIKAQSVPKTLHVVVINELFAADKDNNINVADHYGRLITDIPQLQLDGNLDLSLTSAGAASVPLTGNAIAVSNLEGCEEELYYGTMTEEVFGNSWKDDVVALAVENGDLDLASGDTATLSVRAVFGAGMASQRKANSNFTFAIEDAPASTASDTRVDAETGVVTAGSTSGSCVVSVTLKEASNVKPAYVLVTVAGA